ncbi:sorting nexin-24-like [Microplitis mediator]|uniref:sorting nexin-24-like n=1 Tax=Microplitis mediator TaxID=375433 RepID=UPI002552FD64|nr:sorting nexin-24-like [Microplitis mediator]XP_057320127.1 sorting nexin-24-like [Microplitis mediator]XP_057320128.1 sorting nexin-24-like [Microplitis mediator]
MYHVFISGYRLVEADHGKSFYVYTIEVTDTDTAVKYTIERRYSAFNALHRRLKKINDTISFPPKRVRNSQPKVLELRRAALENYIIKMLHLSETKQQVLEFLGIESCKNTSRITPKSNRVDIKKNFNGRDSQSAIGHHPVITFKYDPYINPDNTSSLPDIVIQGALDGIYKS